MFTMCNIGQYVHICTTLCQGELELALQQCERDSHTYRTLTLPDLDVWVDIRKVYIHSLVVYRLVG